MINNNTDKKIKKLLNQDKYNLSLENKDKIKKLLQEKKQKKFPYLYYAASVLLILGAIMSFHLYNNQKSNPNININTNTKQIAKNIQIQRFYTQINIPDKKITILWAHNYIKGEKK